MPCSPSTRICRGARGSADALPRLSSAADSLGPRFGAEVVLLAGGAAAADSADQRAIPRDLVAARPDDHAVALAGAQPEAGIVPGGLDEFLARAAEAGRERGLALGGLEGDVAAAVGPQEIDEIAGFIDHGDADLLAEFLRLLRRGLGC